MPLRTFSLVKISLSMHDIFSYKFHTTDNNWLSLNNTVVFNPHTKFSKMDHMIGMDIVMFSNSAVTMHTCNDCTIRMIFKCHLLPTRY